MPVSLRTWLSYMHEAATPPPWLLPPLLSSIYFSKKLHSLLSPASLISVGVPSHRRYFIPSLSSSTFSHPFPCTPPPSIQPGTWQRNSHSPVSQPPPPYAPTSPAYGRLKEKKKKRQQLQSSVSPLPVSTDHVRLRPPIGSRSLRAEEWKCLERDTLRQMTLLRCVCLLRRPFRLSWRPVSWDIRMFGVHRLVNAG